MKKILALALGLVLGVPSAFAVDQAFKDFVPAQPAAASQTGTEVLPEVQSAATAKVTTAQLATYVLGTPLTSSVVIGKWSGTCNASSFLRGDGACAAAGTGTVTSVALTTPSWLSVAGSPVTTSGTLAVTATTGQTANSFLATPDGSTGAVSLRTITLGDLPTITAAKGGTGLTSATDDAALVGNGTTWLATAIPNCGSSTQALAYSTSTNAFSCQTVTGSGGSPAGSNTQIQFNNSGAFGADAGFTFNSGSDLLLLGEAGTTGHLQGFAAASGAASNDLIVETQAGPAGFASGNLTIQTGAGGSSSSTAGNLTITAGAGGATNGVGGNMALTAGAGSGSGTAGTMTIKSGAGGTTSAGATLTLQTGNGGTTSGNGGALTVTTGANGSGGSGASGALNLRTGDSANGTGAGNILLEPGDALTTGNVAGASLTAQAGTGFGAGNGGTFTVKSGLPGATGTGGTLTISGSNGGATSGAGGPVNISGGTATDGNGGAVTLNGGAGVGTNRSGGNATVGAGARTGSGTEGVINLNLAGTTVGQFTSSTAPKFVFGTTSVVGTIKGADSSGTAQGLQIFGGDGTGASNNGGDITIRGGLSANNAGAFSGNLFLNAGPANGGTGGYVSFNTGPPTERFRILANGAWSVGSTGSATGTSGQVLTSTGSTTAPTWQTPTAVNTVRQAVSTADATRTSTTTPTQDTDLTITSVAAGFYSITGNIEFQFAGSGTTPGYKFGFYITNAATATSTIAAQCVDTNASTSAQRADIGTSAASAGSFSGALNSPVACAINGTIRVASTSDIAMAFAQATSSGTATTRQAGSWIRIEKLQ